ncbi:hypothetical protein FRC06_010557, partial [Ceratobasidium sp. 370]
MIGHCSTEFVKRAAPSSRSPFLLIVRCNSHYQGTERGHALFDATTLDTQETLESKRQKFRTQKGAYWDDTRKQFHNKSDKI